MKTSVAIILLLVCLSGMTINQADGIRISCKWGGCPHKKACHLCCDHLRSGCIGGKCVKRRKSSWLKTKCVCDCPSG
ncbi:Hypothetical predicted protein [Mytilus galloprovincialis]|uniref:Uncharacterized protein n=1 Tax=Mytilus galloprovincialis TaxID=29158 RepID=A0A8B6C265_MYTGA|nr:Hypothetical predicted protein [Mytilus galloprovincialis]